MQSGEYTLSDIEKFTNIPQDYAIALYELKNTLEILNKNSIYYCDLKPSNIVMSKDGKFKIIDFGSIVFDF